MEAESVGVDVGDSFFGRSVLEEFSFLLSHSINLSDTLYYTLVRAYTMLISD